MGKTALILLGSMVAYAAPTLAGDYLDGDQLKHVFCNKTFDGQNHKSGWTFKNYYNADCDRIDVKYLTGDRADDTRTMAMRIYANGDHCVIKKGKERCGKWKDMGNGVYHKFSGRTGKHIITAQSLVEGKQF